MQKKNKYSFCMLMLTLAFASCTKDQPISLGVPDPDQYTNVYMPRAAVNNPYITGLPLADTTYTFSYNAYLGGFSAAGQDMNIRFEVKENLVDSFNTRNNTNYELLPAGSYQLVQSSVIPSGQRSTPTLTLSIKTSDVNPFQPYLLPVSIADASGKRINNSNGTTYYVFTRSYMADVEKRQKVLSTGTALDWANKTRIIMARGAQNTLVLRHKDNKVFIYLPQPDGTFNPTPKAFVETWREIKWVDAENLYYINEVDAVIRNYPFWAGLFYMKWTPDLTLRVGSDAVPDIWTEWWLGDFWNPYTTIIPFKNYFLLINGNGDLLRQPLLSRVEAPKTTVGSGFSAYKQVVAWDNYLLALSADGNLWLYKMSADAVPGERILVGTGWNRYEKLLVIGKDVLALDLNGDIYRYQFDPASYLD